MLRLCVPVARHRGAWKKFGGVSNVAVMQISSSNSLAHRARLSTKPIAAALVVTFAAAIAVVTAISDHRIPDNVIAGAPAAASHEAIAHDGAELTPVTHESRHERLGPYEPAN
ncbi:MAG: hypothetical protein ACT4OU_05155 [Hyphomicrobium sp.]